MVKIKELTSEKGVVKGTELEFDGTMTEICADIYCITTSLLDKAFKGKSEKKMAKKAIATTLMFGVLSRLDKE